MWPVPPPACEGSPPGTPWNLSLPLVVHVIFRTGTHIISLLDAPPMPRRYPRASALSSPKARPLAASPVVNCMWPRLPLVPQDCADPLVSGAWPQGSNEYWLRGGCSRRLWSSHLPPPARPYSPREWNRLCLEVGSTPRRPRCQRHLELGYAWAHQWLNEEEPIEKKVWEVSLGLVSSFLSFPPYISLVC